MLFDLSPLTPVNCFEFQFRCSYIGLTDPFPRLSRKNRGVYTLPDLSPLCHEEPFAEGAIGWNEEGLELLFKVDHHCEQCAYPDITRGDSLELFIDTRDVKTSGYNTRHCHHFFFLPEAVEGHQKGEITRFRTEDRHELCDPSLLGLVVETVGAEYDLHVWIPKECLVGFDPEQFNRIGFAYRVNRYGDSPQHFCVSSEDYKLEEQPSLWSHCRLEK